MSWKFLLFLCQSAWLLNRVLWKLVCRDRWLRKTLVNFLALYGQRKRYNHFVSVLLQGYLCCFALCCDLYINVFQEEKQRARTKEKLDKCIKEKLVFFCDVLDIPINRSHIKKVSDKKIWFVYLFQLLLYSKHPCLIISGRSSCQSAWIFGISQGNKRCYTCWSRKGTL